VLQEQGIQKFSVFSPPEGNLLDMALFRPETDNVAGDGAIQIARPRADGATAECEQK
jgi:hypothetical protein